MLGMMMDRPLLIAPVMAHAAAYHGDREIVSRTVEGPIHRYTYAEAYRRMQQLANALVALGVKPGDRVATLAWNGYRHLELYYAISGIGAVCHTINPRLFPDQLAYIVNHAEDRFLFTDLTFVPLVEALAPNLKTIEATVVLTDRDHMPETGLSGVLCYEELLEDQPESFDWAEFDENTAAALCYTSGTTGHPKGALYSHRSTLLHALCCLAGTDGTWAASRDAFLVVVPMFHVCAWGAPYSCPMVGAKLVFPGPGYDGESLHGLIEDEGVTMTAGVPTIWLGLLDYLRQSGKRLDGLERMVCGGAAPPMALIRAMQEDYGVEFVQGWGMTETSPVAAVGVLAPGMETLPPEEFYAVKSKAGRPPFGVEMKIVDDDGRRLPHDGEASGELLVRGPYVIRGYYGDEAADAAAFDAEGWFRTGDVAAIDPRGYMQITDRTKDLIKSGGEWISSIELENAVMAQPDVAEAAAIARPHPKWLERPLLVIVPKPGTAPSKDDILGFLADKVAKWWLPDDVVFVEDLPHTATGKVSKARLRERFKDYKLPTA
jgi:fatty-acyl-CoA synthase